MTEANTQDRTAADATYRQALDTAKAELDAIEPKIQKLLERRAALRQVLNGCSTLLGVPIDPKHDWRVQAERAGIIVHKAGRRS